MGVRLRVDPVHVARRVRVHHHDDGRPARRTERRRRVRRLRRISTRRRALALRSRSFMSKQPNRGSQKRRPQQRKGRTAMAAKGGKSNRTTWILVGGVLVV